MQIDSDFELQIKMVIIGDSGVGKTNFIFQFTENRFSGLHIATVGFDYKTKIISLPSSKKKVKIQIWDTAGQERYMALNKNIFQKVQGIIIMYDLTKRNTFENLDKWMHVLSQSVSGKVKFLVANKLDKASEQRIVSEEEGQKYADENNMKFFEASGYTGKNVENIFTQMAEMIYENITDDKSSFRSEASIVLAKKDHKKKKKCCK